MHRVFFSFLFFLFKEGGLEGELMGEVREVRYSPVLRTYKQAATALLFLEQAASAMPGALVKSIWCLTLQLEGNKIASSWLMLNRGGRREWQGG